MIARAASSGSAPASRAAVSAPAALTALCAPGTDRRTSRFSQRKRAPSGSSTASGASYGVAFGGHSARSSGRFQTTGWAAFAMNCLNVASRSSRERYVEWWSSSAFVRTAISGENVSSERSDSSASMTIHSPLPHPAFASVSRNSPPTTYAGSSPQPRSTWTTIPDVVVFPCVPLIAMHRLSDAIWASRSARWSSLPIAAWRSGFSGGIAVEYTTSASFGTFAAACPIVGSIPCSRSRSV